MLAEDNCARSSKQCWTALASGKLSLSCPHAAQPVLRCCEQVNGSEVVQKLRTTISTIRDWSRLASVYTCKRLQHRRCDYHTAATTKIQITCADPSHTSWLSGTGRKSETSTKRCGRAISTAPPKRLTGLQTSSMFILSQCQGSGGIGRATAPSHRLAAASSAARPHKHIGANT